MRYFGGISFTSVGIPTAQREIAHENDAVHKQSKLSLYVPFTSCGRVFVKSLIEQSALHRYSVQSHCIRWNNEQQCLFHDIAVCFVSVYLCWLKPRHNRGTYNKQRKSTLFQFKSECRWHRITRWWIFNLAIAFTVKWNSKPTIHWQWEANNAVHVVNEMAE